MNSYYSKLNTRSIIRTLQYFWKTRKIASSSTMTSACLLITVIHWIYAQKSRNHERVVTHRQKTVLSNDNPKPRWKFLIELYKWINHLGSFSPFVQRYYWWHFWIVAALLRIKKATMTTKSIINSQFLQRKISRELKSIQSDNTQLSFNHLKRISAKHLNNQRTPLTYLRNSSEKPSNSCIYS